MQAFHRTKASLSRQREDNSLTEIPHFSRLALSLCTVLLFKDSSTRATNSTDTSAESYEHRASRDFVRNCFLEQFHLQKLKQMKSLVADNVQADSNLV
ncbi:hypothetical protein TNCV_3891431 [Trichonephila clavipes]|nr:hypothetical protein TNCV_3891431 [Trichonephila clavipes]